MTRFLGLAAILVLGAGCWMADKLRLPTPTPCQFWGAMAGAAFVLGFVAGALIF